MTIDKGATGGDELVAGGDGGAEVGIERRWSDRIGEAMLRGIEFSEKDGRSG